MLVYNASGISIGYLKEGKKIHIVTIANTDRGLIKCLVFDKHLIDTDI